MGKICRGIFRRVDILEYFKSPRVYKNHHHQTHSVCVDEREAIHLEKLKNRASRIRGLRVRIL